MNINKKELFEKVESLVDQLVQLVSECDLTEVKEYVEYYDLVAKMIVASGQTPIEKITHASTLISILHLRLLGREKIDQLASSGMKMQIEEGKLAISYSHPQEITSIAKEAVFDLSPSNSKISGFKQLFSDADSENSPEYQNALNNGGIFNKILTKSLDRIQTEFDIIFDAVVVAMDRNGQTNDGSNVEVIILRGFVRDCWFNFIEVWRDKGVSYRAANEVKIVRKVKFGDRESIGYDYLINIPGFNLQPGDLIKFVII